MVLGEITFTEQMEPVDQYENLDLIATGNKLYELTEDVVMRVVMEKYILKIV